MKYIVVTFLIVFVSLTVYSQTSTLWLLNGKKIQITDYKIANDSYNYPVLSFTNKKGKTKYTDVSDVFSITSLNGDEDIIYKKNPELGNDFEVDEMRNFLNGNDYALRMYKGDGAFIGGLASGIAGGLIPALGVQSATIPLGSLVPVSYVIITSNTTRTVDQIQADNPEINTNEHYLMGVQQGIKEKRMKKSVLGAGIGFAIGLSTFFLLLNE